MVRIFNSEKIYRLQKIFDGIAKINEAIAIAESDDVIRINVKDKRTRSYSLTGTESTVPVEIEQELFLEVLNSQKERLTEQMKETVISLDYQEF